MALAKHLESHPSVEWVNYPGLPSSKDHALAQQYLDGGYGAILTFGIKGGRDAGQAFISGLELFSHLANIGDAKSLAIHPATTTHSQLNDEELASAGVTPETVRLSVGIEAASDLIKDIDQALAKATA
jgi:O-acetylhomoserine (thiol)-lyase